MNDRPLSPPGWRVVWAFIVAPAAAALAFATVAALGDGLSHLSERVQSMFGVVAVFGGYAPALIFGLPAFLLLRKRTRRPFRDCIAAGAGVAALPWLLIAMSGPPGAWLASGSWVNSRAAGTGDRTALDTLLEVAMFVSEIAFFGALGGAVFWLVAAAGHRERPPQDTVPKPQPR